MAIYKIKVNYKEKIEAKSKEDAILEFFNKSVYDTQSDPRTFIEDNLKIKKINN